MKRIFPVALMLAAAGIGAPPLPAAAQGTQQPITTAAPSGRCGQPFALTHVYAIPLDVAAAGTFQTTITRYEPQYLEFSLASAQRFAIRTANIDGDPVLGLYDSTGTGLALSDDDGGNLNALIDMELPPGTYCAQVRALGFEPDMSVPVTVELATGAAADALAYVEPMPGDLPMPCSDPSMTFDIGQVIGAGFGSLAREGFLQSGTANDWRLTLDSPMAVALGVSSPDFDTVIELYDAAGNYVASNDDGPTGTTDSLMGVQMGAGDHCVRVSSFDGTGLGAFSLTLSDNVEGLEVSAGPFGGYCGANLTQDLGFLDPGATPISVALGVPSGGAAETLVNLNDFMALRVAAESTQFDTVMRVFDSYGFLVAENDDGPNGTNSELTAEFGPGPYCMVLEGFAGTGGEATLTVESTAFESTDPDPALACADPSTVLQLGRLQPGFGLLDAASGLPDAGVEYYSFSVTQSMPVTVDVRSTAFDTVASLSSAMAGQFDLNDDYGPSTDSRMMPVLEPGTYCLSVWSFGGTGAGGTYQVALTEGHAAMDDTMPAFGYCANPDLAADLGVLSPGFGSLTMDSQIIDSAAAEFRMTLSQPLTVRVDAGSAAVDTYLRVGDWLGNIVAENDDGPNSTDSSVEIALEQGDWCLSVAPFSSGSGPVTLTVAEAGAAAPGAALRGEAVPTPADGIAVEDLGALNGAILSNTPSPDQARWMAFTLEAPGRVQIDGLSASGGMTVRLFAQDGSQIGTAQAWGSMERATIREDLPTGRYLVSATMANGVEGRLRSVTIRPIQ